MHSLMKFWAYRRPPFLYSTSEELPVTWEHSTRCQKWAHIRTVDRTTGDELFGPREQPRQEILCDLRNFHRARINSRRSRDSGQTIVPSRRGKRVVLPCSRRRLLGCS